MSSKTKTGLFQTPVSKPVASRPTTPRGKLGSSTPLKSDADSPSTNMRFSLDRASPKTAVTSRPTTPRGKLGSSTSLKSDADSPSNNLRFSFDRASPKTITSRPVSRSSSRVSTPDNKLESRINRPSELQAQLQAAQDDLRKAKEKLVLVEKEKSQALSDLKDAKELANEANEKLQQALVAQKRAEDSSEIDSFRAVELEQAGIEAAQKKDEEWKKELEAMKSQLLSHDMTSFLTSTDELQKVKQELAVANETKSQALAHADEATKIAEFHAEKVEFLSSELARLKGTLESKAGDECSENGSVVESTRELGLLREELEKARSVQLEFIEKEKCSEKNLGGLKLEMESLRIELNERKERELELVEKVSSYEKIVAERTAELASREHEMIEKEKLHETVVTEHSTRLAMMEQKLLEAKTCEHEAIEKEKSYKKNIEELELSVDSLQQNLETVKASEEDFVEREKSCNIIVTELKSEIDLLKQELDKANGFEEIVVGLKSEIDLLNQELEKAKSLEEEMIERETLNQRIVRDLDSELQVAKTFGEKLTTMEESYEHMNIELEASRMAESYALNSLSEWKRKAEELESKVAETTRLERLASESLESALKQIEGNSDIIHEAECEVSDLKEKASMLEISLGKRNEDFDELECRLRKANEGLLIEKSNLVYEMDKLKEEEEKNKMAMLEVSTELSDAKERLLSNEEERENFEAQIEHLQLVLKATSEKYEAMLEDSKQEIDSYKLGFDSQMKDLKVVLKASNDKYESMLNNVKQEYELEHVNRKSEWEAKEQKLLSCVKRLEEKETSMIEEWEQKENQLVDDLKRSEEDKSSMEKEIARLEGSLRDALDRAKADCLKLEDNLQGKDDELRGIMRENEQLRVQDGANVQKIEELTRLLGEAKAYRQSTVNEEVSDTYKHSDLLPNVVEFSEENGHSGEKETVPGMSNGIGSETFPAGLVSLVEVNEKPVPVIKEKVKEESLGSEAKMWESYKVDREFSTEMETEQGSSFDDEVESKADNTESLDSNRTPYENGSNSETKQQKKKKPLYRKFSNLLKKGISSPK